MSSNATCHRYSTPTTEIPTTKSARTADIAILAVQAKADAAALGIPIIAAVHNFSTPDSAYAVQAAIFHLAPVPHARPTPLIPPGDLGLVVIGHSLVSAT